MLGQFNLNSKELMKKVFKSIKNAFSMKDDGVALNSKELKKMISKSIKQGLVDELVVKGRIEKKNHDRRGLPKSKLILKANDKSFNCKKERHYMSNYL